MANATVNITVFRPAADLAVAVSANLTEVAPGERVNVTAELSVSSNRSMARLALYDGDPGSGGLLMAKSGPLAVEPGSPENYSANVTLWAPGTHQIHAVWENASTADPDPADDEDWVAVQVTPTGVPPASHPVKGNVTDENGNRPPGLGVEVCVTRTAECSTASTSAGGSYQVDLASFPSTYAAGDNVRVVATNATSGKTGTAFGTVVDGTGETLVDVTIVALPELSAGAAVAGVLVGTAIILRFRGAPRVLRRSRGFSVPWARA